MTLTDEQIEEIKARAEAATPGPWRASGPALIFGEFGDVKIRDARDHNNNAAFIAHARTDIPALLSALEAEKKRADEAEALAAARDASRTVTEAMVEALKRIRDTAMEHTLAARIPECGVFGGIAQDADWLLSEITAAMEVAYDDA